jgi:hypothetical protein
MKPTVYIETTIVSYLVARPSRDALLSAHQELTREWWQTGRDPYRCVTSEEVLREASLGDAEMSRLRLEALVRLVVLPVGDEARGLARDIIRHGLLPPAAIADAVHAAVAALNRVDILATWNCRHLANPAILGRLRQFVAARGWSLPEVCTPVELVGN